MRCHLNTCDVIEQNTYIGNRQVVKRRICVTSTTTKYLHTQQTPNPEAQEPELVPPNYKNLKRFFFFNNEFQQKYHGKRTSLTLFVIQRK